jgi:hypothetical protein
MVTNADAVPVLRRMVSVLAVCAMTAIMTVALGGAASASTVSRTPNSSWQFDGRVRASVIIGTTAYVGGEFTQAIPPASAADQTPAPRARLAAIDLTTGDLLSWNPAANNKVWALAASPDGSTVYAGGAFTAIDGVSRSRLAAFSTAGGQLTSWNAKVGGLVRSILVTGTHVYVGGQFSQRLRRFDPSTGALDSSWQPKISQIPAGDPDPSTGGPAQCPPRCTPAVTSLAAANSGDIYVGGHFGLVNGTYRNNGAAVSSADGSTMAWHPDVFKANPTNPNQKNYIYGIAVSPATTSHPDRVFICGDFYEVGGNTSPNLAAVDAVSGAYDTRWRSSTDGGAPACVLGPDDNLYVGGHFRYVGGIKASQTGLLRNHAAALSAQDPPHADGCYCAYPNDWNPNLNSSLGTHTLAASAAWIVVGGDFTKVNGKPQAKYAQFPVTP